MEKFFPVELTGSSAPLFRQGAGLAASFRPGKIERILEPGKYIVSLDEGLRVTARGLRTLKINTPVRVFPNPRLSDTRRTEGEPAGPTLPDGGSRWSVLMPLGFGGKEAAARLQIYVEKRGGSPRGKFVPAVYFVFFLQTEGQRELQWSIYLKDRQVSLQVFAGDAASSKEGLKDLIASVENGLRKRGFVLATPTVLLRHPFRVPEGFRLNVRG